MAHILNLPHASRLTFDRISATIRAIRHAATAEHRLALQAASRAELPRQRLREVQAMYLTPSPVREDDPVSS